MSLNEPLLNKSDEIDSDLYNNSNGPWNYRMQLLLKKLGEDAELLKYLHDQDQRFYVKKLKIYNICEGLVMTLLSTLMGIQFISTVLDSFISSPENVAYFFVGIVLTQIVLLILYNIIKTFKNGNDLPNKIKNHNDSKISYSNINLSIKQELAKDVENRFSSDEFLSNVVNEFTRVESNAKQIRKKTIDKCSKVYGRNLFSPIESDKIKINIPSNNNLTDTDNSDEKYINNKLNYQINKFLNS